ncbi:hypothetical protein Tco_1531721 [Tanacetum coccineum]
MITDVNVNKLHQPWRSFAAVINKCLSGKSTGFYDSLRLSQAQILWGIYHKKNVDYAYLLLEDFVYQVENKNVKRSNEMYYPRFTKVIVNLFMTKDQSIPRRNKAAKPAKKKQPAKTSKAKGLTVLSEVALTEAEQMELATKRSLVQTHNSHASSSGTDEGTSNKPGVPDVPTYASDDEQISWKSSDEEDNDEVAMSGDDDDDDGQDHEQTDSDNDGDDFVHLKFSTHDEEDKEEDSFDPRVQTPSHVESTDDEDGDEEIQGANVIGEELNEEETNEEDEVNELYRDMNVNL